MNEESKTMNQVTAITMPPTEGKTSKKRISKKKLVGIGIVLLLVIVLVVAVLQRNTQTISKKNTVPQTLVIGGTDKMGSVLDARQYTAAYYGIIDYLSATGGTAKTTADIVNMTVSLAGVQLTIKTTNPQKQFVMVVDGSVWDRLTLTVPQDNYKSTVSVYGNDFPGTKIN